MPPSAQKILFCVRPDLEEHVGGDTIQILRTKRELERSGHHVSLCGEPHLPRGSFDLAHLWHLGRAESYIAARACDKSSLPFVISTIYWPTEEYARHGNVGLLKLLHGALSSSRAEQAKDCVRALQAPGAWRVAMAKAALLTPLERMRWILKRARVLLPNSHAEARMLERFGVELSGRLAIVVNATDAPSAHAERGAAEALPASFLLSVGRIEPRKNQLALLRALRGMELPLVLVGGIGKHHASYYSKLVSDSGMRAIHVSPRARPQLDALYSTCEAHIAPAWYETPGLASLEAAAAGARIVTTDRGGTREYFGAEATYLDPSDDASIRSAVERALARPRSEALRERVSREFCWERAAAQTVEAYRTALS